MNRPRNAFVPPLLLVLGLSAAAAAVSARPALRFPGKAEPEMPPVAVQYATATSFDGFLAASPADRNAWREMYEASSAIVLPHAERLREIPGEWHLLVVAETYCSDALNSVPHLARLAAEAPNLELRLLGKADAEGLLLRHRVEGRGRIPLVLVLDGALAERAVWIERPAALKELVAAMRAAPGEEDIGSRIRVWYGEDGGRSALDEIVGLIEAAVQGADAVPAAPVGAGGAEAPLRQCSGE